jgi:tetratricopeptide (TPR) repeat protein
VAALEESEDVLEEFHAGSVSAAAAFDLSYRDLPAGQQRLFRSLGLHPGPDIDARAAAAMVGAGLAPARRMLDALYDNHLVEETARGRYAMHDLLRAYARALAAEDPDDDPDGPVGRLLDYYLHAARAAGRHLSPPAAADDRDQTGLVPAFPTRDRALAWMRAERLNLQACVERAAATARYPEAVGIAEAMSGFLYDEGYWDQARAIYQTAAAAGKAAGERPDVAGALSNLGTGQAKALTYRGSVQYVVGDYRAATDTLTQALQLFRGLSDPAGHAEVLLRLAAVQMDTGDYPAAAGTLAEALPLYRDLGDRAGLAATLGHIGVAAYETGDYPAAGSALNEALTLYRELGDGVGRASTLVDLCAVQAAAGDRQAASAGLTEALALSRSLRYRLGEANALNRLGALWYAAGDHPAAADALTEALGIYGEIGDRRGQARALSNLGATARATGDFPAAAASLTQALGLSREIGDRSGQAEALSNLGELHLASGDQAEALSSFTSALAIARELKTPLREARALAGLGRCLAHGADKPGAADHLSQALAIYQRLNAPEAAGVAAELSSLERGKRP